MTIRLDHTIVPAKDKIASAEFFAEIFGLTAKHGYFAPVQVNDSVTLGFAHEPEPWGGGGDPRTSQIHQYAFQVSETEFEAIFGRVQAEGARVRQRTSYFPVRNGPRAPSVCRGWRART